MFLNGEQQQHVSGQAKEQVVPEVGVGGETGQPHEKRGERRRRNVCAVCTRRAGCLTADVHEFYRVDVVVPAFSVALAVTPGVDEVARSGGPHGGTESWTDAPNHCVLQIPAVLKRGTRRGWWVGRVRGEVPRENEQRTRGWAVARGGVLSYGSWVMSCGGWD